MSLFDLVAGALLAVTVIWPENVGVTVGHFIRGVRSGMEPDE